MNPSENRQSAPVTDSPWFWMGIFGTAALLGLLLIGPKYLGRHERLQQQARAREIQHARELQRQATSAGEEPARIEVSPLMHARTTLLPIALAVAGLVLLASAMLMSHRRKRPPPQASRKDQPSEETPAP